MEERGAPQAPQDSWVGSGRSGGVITKRMGAGEAADGRRDD